MIIKWNYLDKITYTTTAPTHPFPSALAAKTTNGQTAKYVTIDSITTATVILHTNAPF